MSEHGKNQLLVLHFAAYRGTGLWTIEKRILAEGLLMFKKIVSDFT